MGETKVLPNIVNYTVRPVHNWRKRKDKNIGRESRNKSRAKEEIISREDIQIDQNKEKMVESKERNRGIRGGRNIGN